MAEYTESVTICDRCYPDFLPSFAFFPIESVKGIIRGDFGLATLKGWEERDYGHICPDCVTLEAEENADEGEIVMGHDALMERVNQNEDT